MKIVLIAGISNVGKTAICKELCENYKDKYNFINSYTDREKRDSYEWGHDFIDSTYMDLILESPNIVAKSEINGYRYCALKNQFDENKINLYIVDINGINDTIKFFDTADIMTVLIRRNEAEGDLIRENRDIQVPSREDVDFLIDNNGTLQSSANLLNILINMDFFRQPSHYVQTTIERIDSLDERIRLLTDIKHSLYEQFWYQYYNLYRELCSYVEEQINKDFDFTISVKPDTSPDIYDGFLTFNVCGRYDYEELVWDEMNRLVERLIYHARHFCKENNCRNEIEYRMRVYEYWNGLEQYE